MAWSRPALQILTISYNWCVLIVGLECRRHPRVAFMFQPFVPIILLFEPPCRSLWETRSMTAFVFCYRFKIFLVCSLIPMQEFVGDKINAGIYVCSSSVLNRIELKPTSIEREVGYVWQRAWWAMSQRTCVSLNLLIHITLSCMFQQFDAPW